MAYSDLGLLHDGCAEIFREKGWVKDEFSANNAYCFREIEVLLRFCAETCLQKIT